MNRATELDAGSSQGRSKAGLPGKDQTVLVYRLEKENLTVRLFSRRDTEPMVELVLGTEARSFPLSEFIHFWLTMIEVGLNRDTLELRAEKAPARTTRSTP